LGESVSLLPLLSLASPGVVAVGICPLRVGDLVPPAVPIRDVYPCPRVLPPDLGLVRRRHEDMCPQHRPWRLG